MLTAFVLLLSAAVLLYLLFLAWPRCSLRCHALAPGARAAPLAGTACLKEGFASRKVPEQLDTIVIGSGAAGLTAAALLAKRGQRVLVLEQHDVAGGCTHTFEERGFEFDVGLHYVGDILGVLLNAVTSGVIEWAPTGRLVDEVYFGDDVVPILSPKAAFLAELRRRFPSEGAALHSYSWRVLLAHVWLGAHLGLKVLPAALAAPLLRALGGMQTTQTALERLTGSPKLRHVLSYIWGTYGVPPSRSPFAFHLVLQNHYFNGEMSPRCRRDVAEMSPRQCCLRLNTRHVAAKSPALGCRPRRVPLLAACAGEAMSMTRPRRVRRRLLPGDGGW